MAIIPSFFVAHCYYWGDTHIENFGFERASRISPAKSALDKGMRFTFHQDTPVVMPDMFHTLKCAVLRMTESGRVLGAEQRISLQAAIKALTLNTAYQYGEQNLKGSLCEGKYADFIVTDKNPYKLEIEELDRISILKTYKNAQQVY